MWRRARAASGPSRQARPQPVARDGRDIPVLDVRQGVEPPHLGIRDATRELSERRGDSRVPGDRRLPDHRRSFIWREVVAGRLPPPQGPGPHLGGPPGARGHGPPSPPPPPPRGPPRPPPGGGGGTPAAEAPRPPAAAR